MVRVYQEQDRVVIDLGPRLRDVLLTCGQAEVLENELRAKADAAELQPPTLLTGVMDLKVISYDGFVAIRFLPVRGCTRADKPRMTAEAARFFADLVRFTRHQAAYKMRFEYDPNLN